jgi:hypothetical protein
MEALFETCRGLDVRGLSPVACVLRGAPSKRPERLTRTFATTTRGLRESRAWLLELGAPAVPSAGSRACGVAGPGAGAALPPAGRTRRLPQDGLRPPARCAARAE